MVQQCRSNKIVRWKNSAIDPPPIFAEGIFK